MELVVLVKTDMSVPVGFFLNINNNLIPRRTDIEEHPLQIF